jgi:hypothetical protein
LLFFFSDGDEFGELFIPHITVGACRNSIFLFFLPFLAKKSFQSSIFSEPVFSGPTFSHFVTNLDRLAGQPFQIFLACQILDPDFKISCQIFYVFPCVVVESSDLSTMAKPE